MKCAIDDCEKGADPDGGYLCVGHSLWTAALMARCLKAIETAVIDEDGLDGLEAEQILRALGAWPPKRKAEAL